jgi:hypothetical protein
MVSPELPGKRSQPNVSGKNHDSIMQFNRLSPGFKFGWGLSFPVKQGVPKKAKTALSGFGFGCVQMDLPLIWWFKDERIMKQDAGQAVWGEWFS